MQYVTVRTKIQGEQSHINIVTTLLGLARTVTIYTVYDLTFGYSPAIHTVYTPSM